MSMSISVVGIRKPDKKWYEYKKIINALEAAGLTWEDAPNKVQKFFGYDTPNDKGIEVDLREHKATTFINEEMVDGFSIDISKLPENITHIQFRNCY